MSIYTPLFPLWLKCAELVSDSTVWLNVFQHLGVSSWCCIFVGVHSGSSRCLCGESVRKVCLAEGTECLYIYLRIRTCSF